MLSHVACLLFVFSKGRLAMPRIRHVEKTRRVLFAPGGCDACNRGKKENKMKKLMMIAGVAALAGMMTGCAMIKEMRERQAREEAARKAEMAEKGPVRYWLEKNASPEQLAKADSAKVKDPDLRPLLQYSVASYKAAVASLEKVQVVQDGVAVWERAKVKHSESAKKEIKDFASGYSLPKHMAEHIYMFGGESVRVKFLIQDTMMNELIDWFGKEFKVSKSTKEGMMEVRLKCNEAAMRCWALQYGPYVEILEPQSLRESIKDVVVGMCDKYSK